MRVPVIPLTLLPRHPDGGGQAELLSTKNHENKEATIEGLQTVQ